MTPERFRLMLASFPIVEQALQELLQMREEYVAIRAEVHQQHPGTELDCQEMACRTITSRLHDNLISPYHAKKANQGRRLK